MKLLDFSLRPGELFAADSPNETEDSEWDTGTVGLVGESRGAELALIIGSLTSKLGRPAIPDNIAVHAASELIVP